MSSTIYRDSFFNFSSFASLSEIQKRGVSLDDLTEVKEHYRIPYPDNYGTSTYPKPPLPVVYDNLQVHSKTNERQQIFNIDLCVNFVKKELDII